MSKRPRRRNRWAKWERKMAGTYRKRPAKTPPRDDFNPILFGVTRDACRDLDRAFRLALASD